MVKQHFVHWLNSGSFSQRWLKESIFQLPVALVFLALLNWKDLIAHRFFTGERWLMIFGFAIIFAGVNAVQSRKTAKRSRN